MTEWARDGADAEETVSVPQTEAELPSTVLGCRIT